MHKNEREDLTFSVCCNVIVICLLSNMVRKCVVCCSPQSPNNKLSFHRFPVDEIRRNAWMNSLNLASKSISKDSLVCSKHFKEDDYDDTAKSCSIKMLYKSAIPVINTSKTVAVDKQCLLTHEEVSNETVELLDHPYCCSEPRREPRYVGDLRPEHFSSPRTAKKNLDFLKRMTDQQRKKIKVLQTQKRRVEKRMESVKVFLLQLKHQQLLPEQVFQDLIVYFKK